MDVEKRTTIQAGLDPSNFEAGAQKIAATMTQSVNTIQRALLGSSAAFDAMKNKLIEGNREAMNFATGMQTIWRAMSGADPLKQAAGMVDTLAKSFNLVGPAADNARNAVRAMIDTSASAESRLRATQQLLNTFQSRPTSGPSVVSNVNTAAFINQSQGLLGGGSDPRARADDIAAFAETLNRALDEMRAKLVPLAAAQQQYANQLALVSEAQMKGAVTSDEAAAATERASAAYRDAAQAAHASATALQEQHEAANRSLLGITDPDPQASAKRAADIEAYGKSLDNLRASFDPVFAASKQYEEQFNKITQSQKLGQTSAEQADVALANLNKSFAASAAPLGQHNRNLSALTGGSAQADFAMRQLGVQTIQTLQGFATGQPILMTLIQQWHQMADVMISSGTTFAMLAQKISGTTALLLSFSGVVAGLTAAVVSAPFIAMGAAIEIANRHLIDMQQQLRATRTDFMALGETTIAAARTAAQTTSLSTADARTAGGIIAGAPTFGAGGQNLTQLIALSADLARVFSTDVKTAAQRVAASFNDASKAADELAKQSFPGMTAEVARTVQLLQLQGRETEATNLVLEVYQRQVKGAADAMTPLQRAILAVENNLNALVGHLATFGNAIIEASKGLIKWVTEQLPFDITGKARAAVPVGGDQTLPARMNYGGSGATGLMGIMPSTAALTPSLSPLTEQGNIELGILDLQRKLTAAHGDLAVALKNYSGNTPGYAGMLANADISKLSDNISSSIERIAGDVASRTADKRLTDPAVIDTLKRIAVVESGGSQFETDPRQIAFAQQQQAKFYGAGGTPIYGGGLVGPPAPGPGQQEGAARELLKRINAGDTAFQTSAIAGQRQTLQSSIEGYKDLIGIVGENSDKGKQYAIVLGTLQGQLENLRTPTEENIKQLHDQYSTTGFAAGAATTLAQALKALDEASVKETGHAATAAQHDDARRIVLAGLTRELAVNVNETFRQAEATRGATALVGQSQKAQDDYAASVKASTEALKFGERGSPGYEAAQQVLTRANIAVADSERQKNDMTGAYGSTVAGQRVALQHSIDDLIKLRDANGTTAEQVAILNEKIGLLKGDLLNARTPMEENNKSLADFAKLAAAGDGAARQYAEALHTAEEAARKEGREQLTAAESASVVAQVRARLNAEAATGVATVNRETAALQEQNDKLIGLIDQYGSYAAAQAHLQNEAKAREQVHATAMKNSQDEEQQVKNLTGALDAQVKVRNALALQPAIIGQRQQLGVLSQTAANIGLSPEEQARRNAELQATNQLLIENKSTVAGLGPEYIKLAGDIAAAQVANANLKASYDELANATSQAFDTIGNAIAQSFLTGQGAAVDFKNVIKTVIQQIIQEIIKLSVINPILNSLFPGSTARPTIGSVGNALGGSLFGDTGFFNTLFGPGASISAAAAVNTSTAIGAGGLPLFGPGFAQGGVFSGLPGMGHLPAIGSFANMIVSSPTLFRAYAQGGVMGEAGPEAVMPLVRGPNGALGVRGSGGGTAVVINTPITIQGNATGAGGKLDPQALAALQKQIEGAVKDAARRTIVDEKRPGGDLFGG